MRSKESAGIAWSSIQSQEQFVGDKLRASDAKLEEVKAIGAKHFHMRFNRFELNSNKKPSMPYYFFYFVYLRPFGTKLRLKIASYSQEFFRLLPLFGIFFATVVTLTLHDSLGKVQIFSIDLKLDEGLIYFAKISSNVFHFWLGSSVLSGLLEEGLTA